MIYALILADLLMAGSFLMRFNRMPAELPLFYSRTWGEDQLVDYWFILLVPILLHLFLVLNAYLYQTYFLPDQFIKKIVDTLNWALILTLTFIFIRLVFFVT